MTHRRSCRAPFVFPRFDQWAEGRIGGEENVPLFILINLQEGPRKVIRGSTLSLSRLCSAPLEVKVRFAIMSLNDPIPAGKLI